VPFFAEAVVFFAGVVFSFAPFAARAGFAVRDAFALFRFALAALAVPFFVGARISPGRSVRGCTDSRDALAGSRAASSAAL
jgi:hypothetical protein